MTRSVPYTVAIVGLMLAVSLSFVRTDSTTTTTAAPETDEQRCELNTECEPCLKTNLINKTTVGNNGTTCLYLVTASGRKCSNSMIGTETVSLVVWNLHGCSNIAPSNTTTTTTTQAPTTLPPNSTTTVPPPTTTNATTTTTTVPTTSTASTTTTSTTTVAPSNTTTVAPTPSPANSTTTAKPQPAPTKGGFSWASFIGGIVFAAALSSLAYLIWRFYKVRLDRNYHTLSTNLI